MISSNHLSVSAPARPPCPARPAYHDGVTAWPCTGAGPVHVALPRTSLQAVAQLEVVHVQSVINTVTIRQLTHAAVAIAVSLTFPIYIVHEMILSSFHHLVYY